MRCSICLRNIAAGAEAQKMVVEYQQPDGSVQVRGYMMPDGPIDKATGVLLRGSHSKCFWVAKKREAKGDAVTGRVVSGVLPDNATGSITDEQQVHLNAQLSRLRELAEAMGKGVGDPQVTEAFNALERGGAYPHTHHYRLDTYQLIAHLEYAHGVADQSLLGSSGGLREAHIQLHAQAAHAQIQLSRQADGETEPVSRDWRPQFTAEIE